MPSPRSLTTALFATLALAASACEGDITLVVGDGTLLIGVVTRGPTEPVCRPSVPCDAPFAAGFTVTRNGAPVASFRSGADGRFRVPLPAGGTYRVVPGPDAPLLAPGSQAREVVVLAGQVNQVELQFDTGIR
jgi:hypothetical protein